MAKRKILQKLRSKLHQFSIKKVSMFILGSLVIGMVLVFVVNERFSADTNYYLEKTGQKAKLTVKVTELDGKTVVPNTSVQFLGTLSKFSQSKAKETAIFDAGYEMSDIIVGKSKTDSKGLANLEVDICTRKNKKMLCSIDSSATSYASLYELSKVTPSIIDNSKERRYFSGTTTHDATISIKLKTLKPQDLCL